MMNFLSKKFSFIILGLIVVIHIVILRNLIFFPYPEFFIYPYLTSSGLKPYQQILDQHFPGLMFFPINFHTLGMTTPEIARIWAIGVVIVLHLLLFLVGKEVLKSDRKALLVNFLFLVWQPFLEGWVFWIDNFLPIFTLVAFLAIYKYWIKQERKLAWIFLAGLSLGLGVVFKQVLIPLSAFTWLFLFWQTRNYKVAGSFLLGFLPPIILMIIYIVSVGVWQDFWYWAVVFNLVVYSKYGSRVAPSLAHLIRVAFVLGSSGLILFIKEKKSLQLIFLFLIGSLAGALARFDFVHFQPALPFAILATILGVTRLWSKYWVKIFAVFYLLVAIWWLTTFYRGHIGNKVYFFDNQTKEIAQEVINQTEPRDKIFVFGVVPHLYQMTQTSVAGEIFVFQFPWFLMVAEERVLNGLKRDRPKIIVADRNAEIEGIDITNFMPRIDRYIRENYETVKKIGSVEIMQRKSP